MTGDADTVNWFWAQQALLPHGWADDVRFSVRAGVIESLQAGAARLPGDAALHAVAPGLCNLHSHAFQRGMAGLAEVGSAGGDNFWSWRQLMYQFVQRLDPDTFQAIAELAYMEMLEAGFTRVGEFHYLHHDTGGRPYTNRAEMSHRVLAAAEETGIGVTLLPVFYAHSDFGGAPPSPAQARLIHDLDGFARLHADLSAAAAHTPDTVLGVAPHSLRAVTPDQLSVLTAMGNGPIHLHIAEQQREVDACLAWSGLRPVQWLMSHAPVDERWCLVHATHVTAEELAGIAASKAVVGLCPITEANLGDGLFPMAAFAQAGGRFGVGSDSNVRIDAAGELSLLEYGQRLQVMARNVLAPAGQSTGQWLYTQAAAGGAQALGVVSGLAAGCAADFIELDLNHSSLVHRNHAALLDSWLFAGRNASLRSVWRRGRQWVCQGRHLHRDVITTRFSAAMVKLLAR